MSHLALTTTTNMQGKREHLARSFLDIIYDVLSTFVVGYELLGIKLPTKYISQSFLSLSQSHRVDLFSQLSSKKNNNKNVQSKRMS